MTTTERPAKTLPYIILPCPKCGHGEANIFLDLSSLHVPEGDNFACAECDESFSLNSVRQFVKQWTKILAWIDDVPTYMA